MRTGMKWFIAILVIAIIGVMVGPIFWSLLSGGGIFDPS